MGELNGVVDKEAVMRRRLDELAIALKAQGLDDGQDLAGLVLAADTGLIQQLDKRGGAAVHDGQLASLHLDADIVDAKAANGGQQVLNGGDVVVPVAKAGGQAGINHETGLGAQEGGARPAAQGEQNARVLGRGTQHQFHLLAAMQPNARTAHYILDGSLMHISSDIST